MSEDLSKQIVTQVEYYMSDVNLKRDSFFQSQMSKNDGFIHVDVLLKCNKLKKLTSDADAVMAALEASDLIISEDKKSVKRKTPAPPLDEDVAKRAQSKKRGASNDEDDALTKALEAKADGAVKDRIVYKITGLPSGCGWAEIKDAIKENTKAEGKIFTVHDDGATEAFVSAMAKNNTTKFAEAGELKVNDSVCTFTKIEEEAELKKYWLEQFTKNPPKDVLDKLAKENKMAKRGGGKKDSAKGKRKATSGPMTVAGVTYTSKDEAKAKAMEIAKRNPDSEYEALEGVEADFAKGLLAFHPKAAEKQKALKEVGVGKNPEFPTTRCFFAVQEDGTKVDFSYIKCIDAAPEDSASAGSPKAKKAKTEENPTSPTRKSPRLSPKA